MKKQTQAAGDFRELMNAWNTIEARVKAEYPKRSEAFLYRLTSGIIRKQLGI